MTMEPTHGLNVHKGLQAVILAGGKSIRYGRDKSLESFRESKEPFTITCFRMLKRLELNPIIISNNNDKFASYDIPCITDIIPDKGPLGGIYTGLMNSNAQAILVLTCDMPYVTEAMLHKLIESYQSKKLLTLFHLEKEVYPFPGIYLKGAASLIKQRLQHNDFSVLEFIKTLSVQQLIDGEEFRECFKNINTP